MDPRLKWTSDVLVGHTVVVERTDGSEYRGILSSLSDGEGVLGLKLSMVTQTKEAAGVDLDPRRPEPKLELTWDDVACITAHNIGLTPEDLSRPVRTTGPADARFDTDAAIGAGRGGLANRELERWVPAADDGALGTLGDLEGGSGGVHRGWDQFALNEAKFGVQTDYSDELYTTTLDPSASRYSAAEAARLATEIERASAAAGPGGGRGRGRVRGLAARHLAEERGQALDDGDEDEEDLYSAVIRPAEENEAADGAPAAATTRRPGQQQPPVGYAAAVLGGGRGRGGVTAGAPVPPQRTSAIPIAGGRGGGNGTSGRPPSATIAGSSSSAGSRGAARSSPIDIDPRRETNKLRAQLTEGNKKATSPYGTPGSLSKSPLTSPLVGDAARLAALDLNPGVAPVDEATRREFQEFKASQAAGSARRSHVDEFKAFSQTLETRLGGRGSGNGSAGAGAGSAAATDGVPTTTQSEATPTTAPTAATAPPTATAVKPKPMGLNPFAKSFNFNPGAKEFTPGGTAPAAAPKGPEAIGTPKAISAGARPAASGASTPSSSSGPVAGPPPPGRGSYDQGFRGPRGTGGGHRHVGNGDEPHGPRYGGPRSGGGGSPYVQHGGGLAPGARGPGGAPSELLGPPAGGSGGLPPYAPGGASGIALGVRPPFVPVAAAYGYGPPMLAGAAGPAAGGMMDGGVLPGPPTHHAGGPAFYAPGPMAGAPGAGLVAPRAAGAGPLGPGVVLVPYGGPPVGVVGPPQHMGMAPGGGPAGGPGPHHASHHGPGMSVSGMGHQRTAGGHHGMGNTGPRQPRPRASGPGPHAPERSTSGGLDAPRKPQTPAAGGGAVPGDAAPASPPAAKQ